LALKWMREMRRFDSSRTSWTIGFSKVGFHRPAVSISFTCLLADMIKGSSV